ncbi:MAG: hypothetical protein O9262_14210 [Cyclobacteriaceae bacterium]|nr:hypothetical protein [Cyclobacteriaceae bacterium]
MVQVFVQIRFIVDRVKDKRQANANGCKKNDRKSKVKDDRPGTHWKNEVFKSEFNVSLWAGDQLDQVGQGMKTNL